ncbi:TetR/AcrR family transcriptional regulator [Lentibacillus sp. Marseille-P4043]|uniref:TetR/AcrR family transcriptional regulator n=1 Tax=Lentibacillus sp. Marseille-P4043 TaxID=2040293 RepID=UPI000D0B1C13|nr:TetR family transcriptional regulator [Lentibacillus sp. Marseille-P4043]
MPKLTFYNLPVDKQQTLIHAAKKEFSRVSLYEASIANIVKTAGIPRGSFYQYFKDKEDAFYFLLNEHVKNRKREFISGLKKYNGDIFATVDETYRSMLGNCRCQENRDFFRNAFLNMNHKIENTFTKDLTAERWNQFTEVRHLINTQKLNVCEEHDLFHILQIIIAVTFHCLVRSFEKELTIDESINSFSNELNLLKKGLCR